MADSDKRLGILAAVGCAIALLAAQAVLADDSNQSAKVSASASAENAIDPAPVLPEFTDSPTTKPNSASSTKGNPYLRQSNTDSTQTKKQTNSVKSRTSQTQSKHYGAQASYQSSDQSGYEDSATPSYQRAVGGQKNSTAAMPAYQQPPHGSSSGNSSGQSIFALQARKQNANTQTGNAPNGNMPAGYMQSDEMRVSMQTNSTPSSVMSSNSTPGSVMYGSPSSGGMMSAPMPSSNSYNGRQYSSRFTTSQQPMVTPNAVYLDGNPSGEVVGPAQPRSGSRMLYGKPHVAAVDSSQTTMPSGEIVPPGAVMGQGTVTMDPGMQGEGPPPTAQGYGFTNPYCNNCNGCAGGYGHSWTGPTCGMGTCDGGQCGNCENGECGPCESCGSCHEPYGRPWILAPFDWMAGELNSCHNDWWWGEDLTAFAGVHDFKNITDNGAISSFGFQEGVNWGVPIFPDFGLSAQFGYQATQGDFENDDTARFQSFVTGGVFHRPTCSEGFDMGAVFDWLHDDFFGDSFDIGQIRGQLGWQWNCRNEIGFWFATGVMQSSGFQTLDQYNIYYSRRFFNGGDIRAWAGFTGGNSFATGTMVGADFEVPVARRWAIDGGFNYLIPSDRADNGGFAEETWNLGMNLVWYIGGTAPCNCPSRPLFNVADNGTLMTILHGNGAN
jgi:hypothetical protein